MSRIFDRRRFLATLGMTATGLKLGAQLPSLFAQGELSAAASHEDTETKPYGSGYFGEWIKDEFGLPAFHYTCDQERDPKAITPVTPGILSPREHIHQVGNDRLVAVASNYGHVRVRQDEGAPKFLNDYAPEEGQFGGGIGYLTDGRILLSTFYPGNGESFDRIFGVGYYRKRVVGKEFSIDQVIFAPYGDDPVLVSQATITNHGQREAGLRWIEYWGCQVYEFSYRSWMEQAVGGAKNAVRLRREFGRRFAYRFQPFGDNRGLVESKEFLGRAPADEIAWRKVQETLAAHPNASFSDKLQPPVKEMSFDDVHPLPTFLVSLDAPADSFSTNGKAFFGSGGVSQPSGAHAALDGHLDGAGHESALLLERNLHLKPGENRTLYFLYGYIPDGTDLSSLVAKYQSSYTHAWKESSLQWRKDGLRFRTEAEPWVEREVTWDHYYLRSNLTYDNFFEEHILSQGAIYQYVWGFQGAARDPLQHALPFIFSDSKIVKEILRYTLKEVRADGSIPYGVVGHGMPMPVVSDNSSDMPMWLLWAVSEYVLATRDRAFLNEEVPTYPLYGPASGKESVRNLLARCYRHLVNDVGVGKHGIMRMLRDDWNDALLWGWVPQALVGECVKDGESVLNSAMASYVFDYYARLLAYAGEDPGLSAEARDKAEANRKATRAQWTGKWFRRAWLGPTLGWLGEEGLWLAPQPWAIIGGAADPDQTTESVRSVNDILRRPSPIGAMQLNKSPDMDRFLWGGAGTGSNGGVWPSLNATLIWALALVNGEMAWNEWKKNSFARHAEVYPEIWYSTWSGPDGINSVVSKQPGKTFSTWPDFPVFNMHPHACPLYSLTKLLGVEFTARGVELAPKLPLESYRFDSPLLGVVKSPRGYEGWYAPPAEAGTWIITLRVPKEEAAQLVQAEVNRAHAAISRTATGAIEIRGSSGPGRPLRWAVRRGR